MIEQWKQWKVNRYFNKIGWLSNKSKKKDLLFLCNVDKEDSAKAIQKFTAPRKKLSHQIINITGNKQETDPYYLPKGMFLKALESLEIQEVLKTHFRYVICIGNALSKEQIILLRHFPDSIKIANLEEENKWIDLNVVSRRDDKSSFLSHIPKFIDDLKI